MKKYVRAAIGNISEESEEAKREFAENPDTDISTLTRLAHDSERWVRSSVARNPNASEDLLTVLSKDSDWIVRREVARNPNVSEDLLVRLSGDSYVDVRREVAKNPKTPVVALEDLVRDSLLSVQTTAAENPNATQEIRDIYNSDIDSIKEEVINYVADALNNVIEDFLADLYTELPNRISRYNSDWWDGDSYFSIEDLISRKNKRHYNGEDLEGMVDSVMFGNYDGGAE